MTPCTVVSDTAARPSSCSLSMISVFSSLSAALSDRGAIAEADDIDVCRRDEFKIRLGLDQGAEAVRMSDVLVDQTSKLFDAVLLERHPDLERPKTARGLEAPFVQPLARGEAARRRLKIFGRNGERGAMSRRVPDQGAARLERRVQPLVGIERDRIRLFDPRDPVGIPGCDGD